jgi:hypothetical protein
MTAFHMAMSPAPVVTGTMLSQRATRRNREQMRTPILEGSAGISPLTGRCIGVAAGGVNFDEMTLCRRRK